VGHAQSVLENTVSGSSADCQAQCLRALLVQRLERQGVEQPYMAGFLRELGKLLSAFPDMTPPAANAKLQYLGWTDVALDYQSMQLAAVCLEDP
jgi:hypothetical protein